MSESLLLPVLNVCARDAHLALLTFDVCHKLDGQLDATIMVAHDTLYDASEVLAAAQKAFRHVNHFTYDPWTGPMVWPGPQNWAWQHVAKRLQSCSELVAAPGWLWLEPDAVPVRARWLQQLTAFYLSTPRTLFAGVACSDYSDSWYMNGVGIYPMRAVDALANSHALYTRTTAFDRAAGPEIKRSFKPLSQIEHFTKTAGGGSGRSFTAATLKSLLTSSTLLYHGCTDGSLQLLLLGKSLPRITVPASGRNRFYHSGDLGDIIYSLPAVRELGGGELYLGPDNHTNMTTREKMSSKRAELIAPLLEAQSYVHSVAFSPLLPESLTHDLNSMRHLLRSRRLDQQPGYNLARCYLEAFGLALTNDGPAWLTVPEPRALAPVIINRSPRYHNPDFDWPRLLAHYRGQCLFIGHPDEHLDFCRLYGRIPYESTANLLDAARLIAGSKLFVGNQSVCYAIAEGLKHPAILETCPNVCNTTFERSTVLHGCTAKTILPPLVAFPPPPCKRTLAEPLVLRGPVDSFSGFGQLLGQLATGLAARGHYVRVAPTHFEPVAFQKDIPSISKDYEKLLIDPFTPGHAIVSMHCGLPELIKGGEVVLTMWESTRIADATCVALNKAARVIVPSVWNATSFNACGVNVPISLLPLGIDPDIYKPRPWPATSKPFTFGTAGRVAHGGCRKGIDDVIIAFLAAFKKEPNVRLRIKCFSDCKIAVPADSRITLDRAFKPDLAAWYSSLNCFVTATRAEGWGLHPHQAMACGRPVIAPHYSALTEFYDDSCGWPVDYSIVPATEYYEGKGSWAEPSITSLATQMRHAFEHSSEGVVKGEVAARRAAQFSLSHMLDRFESILKLHNLL